MLLVKFFTSCKEGMEKNPGIKNKVVNSGKTFINCIQ